MVDIYLLRHAHVDYTPPNKITAHNPLTPLGHHMAERLGEHCCDLELDLLAVSPMRRTQETAAAILSRQPELPSLTMPEFAELSIADLADYPEEHPDEDLAVWDDLHYAFGNRQMWQRVVSGWEKLRAIVAEREAERVALVSHGGPLNVIIRHMLGQDVVRLRTAWIQLDYASTSCIRFTPNGQWIMWLNDARHVEDLAPVREVPW